MNRLVLAAALIVLAGPAAAQGVAPLTYVQPLSPTAVRSVQDKLHQMGVYSGAVDGQWGPDSQQALVQFQQTHGLQPTGQLNQGTVVTLGLNQEAVLGIAPPPPPPQGAASPAANLSPEAVRVIQDRLQSFGFYTGPIDGNWGPNTQAAVRDFQQGRGLQPTGQATPTTLVAMGLDPSNPANLH